MRKHTVEVDSCLRKYNHFRGMTEHQSAVMMSSVKDLSKSTKSQKTMSKLSPAMV